MKPGLCLGIAWVLALFTTSGAAHEGRPLHLDLEEQAGGQYRVSWRAPPSVPLANAPEVRLPDFCVAAGSPGAPRLEGRALYRCSAALDGSELSIRYPRFNPSLSTLIRFVRLNGERHVAVLSPEQRIWRVPAAEQAGAVALEYLGLGVRHILGGYDHLLFVACLIFVARSPRRILITITGFTIAHSLTLGLSALDWVRLPGPPVEAVIALSIVFIASELARGGGDTLTWRYPVAVSSSFGLLHGFGFAAVLREVGLPQIELPVALLFFNLGVEVGQVMFVMGLGALVLLARRVVPPARHAAIEQFTAYPVGCMAVFWMMQRLSAFTA